MTAYLIVPGVTHGDFSEFEASLVRYGRELRRARHRSRAAADRRIRASRDDDCMAIRASFAASWMNVGGTLDVLMGACSTKLRRSILCRSRLA